MYQLVGIGNALMDTEFLLSDAQLRATGLSVGQMTLADHDAQQALFAALKQAGAAAVKQASGGSGANSVAAFSALGGRAYYHCRVGDDALAWAYLQDLTAQGVASNAQFASVPGATGTCAVLVGQDGERTMQTHLGVSAAIGAQNIDLTTLEQANWLYLEGYLAMSPSIMPALDRLRYAAAQNGVKIALSFADPAVVQFAKDGLLQLLGTGVAIIFCNLDEAKLFTGKSTHKDAAAALLDYADMVVVTAGAEPTLVGKKSLGGELAGKNAAAALEFFTIASESAHLVDSNGAGDNYAGAFLYALTMGNDLKTCARLAAKVARRVVEQFGARLDTADYQAIKAAMINAGLLKDLPQEHPCGQN